MGGGGQCYGNKATTAVNRSDCELDKRMWAYAVADGGFCCHQRHLKEPKRDISPSILHLIAVAAGSS